MVDLTPTPGPLVTVQAPRAAVSPQQVAQPWTEFAQALDKSGAALGDVADNLAKQAGYKAVTRDADGNIQVDKAPIIGPASEYYARAVKTAALAQGEADIQTKDIALRQQFRDDPEGYKAAAEAYKDQVIKQYTDAGGADLGITLGRTLDAVTKQTYRGLLNESERLGLQRAESTIATGIQSAKDDMFALARGGDTSSDAFQAAMAKYNALTNERVNNPRLAYPPEAAQYDREQLAGQLKGQTFLHDIDQTYQSAPSKADGAKAALEQAKSILTDPSYKLSPQERQQFYSKAASEVHANEAIRRQDIAEARAAESSITMQSALGMPVDPNQVEQVASAFRAAGDPGSAARLYGMFARKPLNDDFGKQPLNKQIEQLNELQGAPRWGAAYQFFIDKGWSPAQASGIVGGLRGETAGLNPGQVHDNGIGIGISGWNGDRRAALSAFAKANGADPLDVKTQLAFVDHELRTTEAATGEKLKAAQTPEEAGNTMLGYFRPKDYDVPGAHPERAHYARVAFNAFSGIQSDTEPLASNPAGSAWLQANHTRVLDKTAQTTWGTIQQDWQKKGMRPPDDVVNQVVNAARLSNDTGLLSQIDRDMQRMDIVQQQSGQSLPQQQADITALHAAANAGTLTPGQADVMADLERRYSAITKGLKDNPISTAVQNFPDKFKAIPPLNLQDPAQLAAGLKMRGQVAQFAQANWQTGPLSALDKADLDQVKAVVDGQDPVAKTQVFSALSTLPEDVRNATLGKLAEKGGPNMAVSVAAGAMLQSAPDVAQSIMRGQQALKTDKAFWPAGGAEATAATQAIGKALPPTVFGVAARTDPTGPYATAMGMVRARYADLSAQAGDVSGKFNGERLTAAINDVTGGVLSHNGAPLIAPQRGMSQADFDRVISGITDADLGNAPQVDNFKAATEALNLTPQEQALYQRHLTNLYGPGGVDNADGSRSTLFQASVERDGKTYNIPTVWDGKILSVPDAVKKAQAAGWDKFPSYASEKEAEARYQQMHAYMDRDTSAYFKMGTQSVTTLNGAPVTADYLRSNAQLESIGSGRYLVRLGTDPSRPIYAYTGANTEAPAKFVLDLRNRRLGMQPPPSVSDMMSTGIQP